MAARPKGYIFDWTPRAEAAVTLGNVREVLDEYRSYGPMTVRQIFYRLVGSYGYSKTELAYKRLGNLLVKARRARLIDFADIRDSGTESEGGDGWSSRAGFWEAIRYTADKFTLDRQLDQPQSIELWCEAAGMVPMLAGMLSEWSIPVYSTGGFSSVTVVKETADRIAEGDRPTVFLHVGDFDPSGESIFESMSEDIGRFVWAHTRDAELFEPVRVALTAEQVELYDLPTAPPKPSDSRSAAWIGETTQAEAMPPTLLEEVVRAAVLEYIDEEIHAEVLERELDDRDEIDRVLKLAEAGDDN